MPAGACRVLNLGAGDGVTADPLWALMRARNCSGTYVEEDLNVLPALRTNLAPFPDVELQHARVPPARNQRV